MAAVGRAGALPGCWPVVLVSPRTRGHCSHAALAHGCSEPSCSSLRHQVWRQVPRSTAGPGNRAPGQCRGSRPQTHGGEPGAGSAQRTPAPSWCLWGRRAATAPGPTAQGLEDRDTSAPSPDPGGCRGASVSSRPCPEGTVRPQEPVPWQGQRQTRGDGGGLVRGGGRHAQLVGSGAPFVGPQCGRSPWGARGSPRRKAQSSPQWAGACGAWTLSPWTCWGQCSIDSDSPSGCHGPQHTSPWRTPGAGQVPVHVCPHVAQRHGEGLLPTARPAGPAAGPGPAPTQRPRLPECPGAGAGAPAMASVLVAAALPARPLLSRRGCPVGPSGWAGRRGSGRGLQGAPGHVWVRASGGLGGEDAAFLAWPRVPQ